MKTVPKLLVFCLSLSALATGREAQAVTGSAIGLGERYDSGAYWLLTHHRDSEAIIYYTAAINENPSDFVAYFNRAGCYLHEGQWSKALQDCDTAAKLKPGYADTYYLRAAALYNLGRHAESRADVDKYEGGKPSAKARLAIASLRVDLCQTSAHPSSSEVRRSLATLDESVAHAKGTTAVAAALNDRAWFLAVCRASSAGNIEQAVRDGAEACRLTSWRDKHCVDTLATAYARKGDFEEAIENERKAIALAWNDSQLRADLRQHLGAFEQHQPYFPTANE